MTSRLLSEMPEEHPAAPASASPKTAANADTGTPQTPAPQADVPHDMPSDVPHVASPPTSPWWTAPAGKAVDIPAFGRALIDALSTLVSPAPRPVPVRIRARR